MKIITRKRIILIAPMLLGVFVSAWVSVFIMSNSTEAVFDETQTEHSDIYLSTSTIPVRVSGVVKAAKSTVVYAETAGVVTNLLAREGSMVTKGEVLVVQATPVLDARLALVSAERELGILQQSLAVEMYSKQSGQAAYRAYLANEIASLRVVGNDSRIQEGVDALLTALKQSIVTITSSVNYVNNNRPLFTAEGLRLYDEVVRDLYGRVPDYFQGGIVTLGNESVSLQKMLEEVTSSKDPVTIKTLSLLMNGQLTALTKLFATGENDVFDRDSAAAVESVQAEYLTERTAVLAAAQSLQTTSATFAQVVDGVLEDDVTQQINVQVTDLDRELALTQASYAKTIATQVDVVAVAGEGVVAAERGLGSPKAPFAGVISRVFVNEGQYVMPGTPLLTLVGDGAREIEVAVPTYLSSGVKKGQVCTVDGKVVGFVDRFSSVSESGSGTVIITLLSEVVPAVGSSLVGNIAVDSTGIVYAVPRSHVHFDGAGAYVTYDDKTTSRVEIVYDTGRVFYVSVHEAKLLPLVAAVSVTL